ncbi:mitotic checkpoint serine/threonine-protein kinase BUB1-like [Melia azedarach]|uniref:Mitotic checkpoint serine/threonine-protein kinase BUB1-like n=1 Tax=Melia azedarach TaxID=155640 RepID=A0ACC1Z164_MELAZ|nr:mitotic checkpoint serine/threonine-protein kinase BUB1-like [Melia azedarach]
MAVILPNSDEDAVTHDPLLPWLLLIKKALDEWSSANHDGARDLDKLLSDCINTFKHHSRYKNDIRFLKIWLLYLEGNKDFEKVFREMEEIEICIGHSLLYQWYALFLEAKGKWEDAHLVYQIGISRKAEPLDKLKEAQSLFIDRMSERLNASSLQEVDGSEPVQLAESDICPWSSSTVKELLNKINPRMTKFDGYHQINKVYSGKVALSSLTKTSRNKMIEIGGKKYQIKGCAGQGGFGTVFKAYVNSNPDEVVAIKIQKPAFPWEFYMYRLLDHRISDKERSSFGYAHRIHLYDDYSILVCDYLSQGTLQDAINSYVVTGKSMEEVLTIYYTIEMLCILESLHDVGIIHGDFKPDNLLIRYSRDELTEHGFRDRSGPWQDQGLCLVDWGRGIDLRLFPENAEFKGECRTSGFRCIEMQEKKPWKFQVDTYGLCVIVHMMLHNSYMEVQKKELPDGGFIYLPKTSFKRYWNVELWKSLFTKLLNSSPGNHKEVLQSLRKTFQDYMCSNPQLLKKLKELLAKQRASLCGA